jgi:metal-sulfur cluster biosynthetic enzyme
VTGDRVDVKITLTSPGCHLGGMIAGHVQSRLLEIEGIEEANVELVWDPPWQPQMISAAGREKLGLALE